MSLHEFSVVFKLVSIYDFEDYRFEYILCAKELYDVPHDDIDG